MLLMNGAFAHVGQHPAVASQAAPIAKQHRAHPDGDQHAALKTGHVHAPAVGIPGNSADIARTITVDMTDAMRFTPASVSVKRGETVRFVVKNSGKLQHEMVLGSMVDLKKHAVMMQKMAGMEHTEENMVFVEPGKTGELIWKFNASGEVDFACLQPGHFEAGMQGKVAVK